MGSAWWTLDRKMGLIMGGVGHGQPRPASYYTYGCLNIALITTDAADERPHSHSPSPSAGASAGELDLGLVRLSRRRNLRAMDPIALGWIFAPHWLDVI